jgi:hypothetical protein
VLIGTLDDFVFILEPNSWLSGIGAEPGPKDDAGKMLLYIEMIAKLCSLKISM